MLTDADFQELAEAYNEQTGEHVDWRTPDELTDKEWEAKFGA